MSKQSKNRMIKILEDVAKQNQETSAYLSDVVLAQNKSGVLVMTLLQMLIEKGILTKEEVEQREAENCQLVLDDDGGCVESLGTLLEDEPEGDEA